MRENRTCGSEGGGAGRPALPTPIMLPSLRDYEYAQHQNWRFGLL